jgi:hypothetical protein
VRVCVWRGGGGGGGVPPHTMIVSLFKFSCCFVLGFLVLAAVIYTVTGGKADQSPRQADTQYSTETGDRV